MKNLIKLLAIIAMITVSASNVCAQVDTTIIALSNTYTYQIQSDYQVIEITTKSEDIISGHIKVNSLKIDSGTFDKSGTIIISYSYKKGDIIQIYIDDKSKKINYNLTFRNFRTGLNNNLLAAELNLYSYDNMVVLENKATPKPLSVNIYNLSGQLVVTENVDGLSSRNEISTTLPNGIYMVHVSDGVNTMVKKLYISK